MNDPIPSLHASTGSSGPVTETSETGSSEPATALNEVDDPFEPIPDSFRIATHDGLGQLCLKSQRSYEPGDVLSSFHARSHHDTPHRMTVQVSEHEHIELGPRFLELINHSCEPNVFFDTHRFALVALSPIAPGDELTFFYPSTEWFMASPFECACGSERCLGRINGASQLPRRVLADHRLTLHIQRLLMAEERREHAFDIGLFVPSFA